VIRYPVAPAGSRPRATASPRGVVVPRVRLLVAKRCISQTKIGAQRARPNFMFAKLRFANKSLNDALTTPPRGPAVAQWAAAGGRSNSRRKTDFDLLALPTA